MSTDEIHPRPKQPEGIDLPAPTSSPFTCAFGVTLIAAGLVTQWIVTIVGAMIMLIGAIGWFKEVHPDNREETIPFEDDPTPITERNQKVLHLMQGKRHRMRVPVEIHPYSSGLWGGVIGGIVMAIVATVGSLIEHGSLWYACNLLSATILVGVESQTVEQLSQFNSTSLIVALIIQVVMSVFIGLIYGATLPMIPRFPLLFAAAFVPLVWTGLTWATISVVNPALKTNIDWLWFIGAQISFGLVAGWWIINTEKIGTMQNWSYLERTGIDSPGVPSQGGEQS
ncbi:MAG: hypothetical protein CMJ29_09550 [Phycisphaerae bacterium]|nr:hypothetical protein [Phycisphaerae bacterium]|tara:strand:+ start:988 stop:1836 length:849 start_codon:yes stop_codon:yes gene_type:complete